MEGMGKMASSSSVAAAFVEGGIQDACDDACSICLEEFSAGDPSTVTCCRHEFHLQCILEWCQRSSQCPMCWQAIKLRDPTSQELLEAVETERSIRANQSQRPAIFHHPALGEFELQHLPVGATASEIEERIIQHLAAAAAATRRSNYTLSREGQRGRSSAHGHPQFLVLSTNSNASSVDSIPSTAAPSTSHQSGSFRTNATPHQASIVTGQTGNNVSASSLPFSSNNRTFTGQSSMSYQDRAGPSDFQSFSESLKSRLSAVSMRYRDSISKSTRGWNSWKERFFSRNASMSDIGSEVRREVDAGIATVSRMMEHIESRDNARIGTASTPQRSQCHAVAETSSGRVAESHANTLPGNSSIPAVCPASSGSN